MKSLKQHEKRFETRTMRESLMAPSDLNPGAAVKQKHQ